MIAFARIVLSMLADVVGLMAFSMRPWRSVEAENLVLRRQLALFNERGVKPTSHRCRYPGAPSLAVKVVRLGFLLDSRSCLIVVRPETVVRWHRAGWRLFWRYESRPGRPPIPLELRQLIRHMATDDPL